MNNTKSLLAGAALALLGVWIYKKVASPKEKDGTWDEDGRLVPKEA